jgi:hypothetical protein
VQNQQLFREEMEMNRDDSRATLLRTSPRRIAYGMELHLTVQDDQVGKIVFEEAQNRSAAFANSYFGGMGSSNPDPIDALVPVGRLKIIS